MNICCYFKPLRFGVIFFFQPEIHNTSGDLERSERSNQDKTFQVEAKVSAKAIKVHVWHWPVQGTARKAERWEQNEQGQGE